MNLTGELDDAFFGRVGRIVVLTTLLEMRIEHLASALGNAPQDVYARMNATELIARCRETLPEDRQLSERIERFLADVVEVRQYRHALVHSRWPSKNYGWRPVQRRAKAGDVPDHLVSFHTSPAEMQSQLETAIRLFNEGTRFQALCAS